MAGLRKIDERHSAGRVRKNIVFEVDGQRTLFRVRLFGGKAKAYHVPMASFVSRECFLDTIRQTHPKFFEYLMFNFDKLI